MCLPDLIVSWSKLEKEKWQVGVALMWQIWCRRNDIIFNGKETPHLILLDRVQRLVTDHNKYATKIYGAQTSKRSSSTKIWKAPNGEVIKLNCDASLQVEGWIRLGVVARNEKGDVLFAGCKRLRGRWPPDVAEGMAISFAVKLGRRYGLKQIIIESDFQGIISRLEAASTFFSNLDKIVDDILFTSSHFDFISWSNVKREANFVAHHLAKLVPFGVE
ncbi:uncharacterized protein LOC110690171 [Chenopodium quinoa]|uniref:uncharacterized protein LOC110690171 n=1 Tax=Chenopodium quinoa TaxID=63459 RepID=UPI000B770799|nr:uncharacterized protein LOC110690171 [Chenopodium quinoa]